VGNFSAYAEDFAALAVGHERAQPPVLVHRARVQVGSKTCGVLVNLDHNP
jgi:hypothetical protein